MRYYEIHRDIFVVKHKDFNKAVRYKAFNNASDKFITAERKQEMLTEQKKFILALRAQMTPDGAYPNLAQYQNKKMTIIPSTKKDDEYLLVFFDKDTDNKGSTNLHIDKEKNLLYLEIEEEEE